MGIPGGSYELQDEDEFETALSEGAITPKLAIKARNALNDLINDVTSGNFPPDFVKNYTFPI